MPNFCQNTLTVWGDETELAEFKSYCLVTSDHNSANELDFTFEGLYPTPEELLNDENPPVHDENESLVDYQSRLKERQENYGFNNWYDWRIHNWGTKWDATDSFISSDSVEDFTVSFATAWSPPTLWLKKVSLKFPNLNFILDYMEDGMGFCGVLKICDGEITERDGEPIYYNEEGDEVHNVDGVWYNKRSKEVIDVYDFFPIAENPFKL
jgi:hypothetical protein